MRIKTFAWMCIAATSLMVSTAQAQRPMAPPAFFGGVPGMAQMNAIVMQRHQARTLLYREALEELRKNPQAADVPVCPPTESRTRTLCLRPPPPQAAVEPIPQETKPAAVTADTAAALPSTRRRIAVLVGNNAYQSPIPALETPIFDVKKVAEVLRDRYGYETKVVQDASKAQIIEAINKVAAEAKPDDSVLLLYAGHGYLMEDTKMGYWIPVDGSTKTAANWISNSDIAKLLQAIPARQVMLVSDSCYSGSLTREQKLTSSLTAKSADIFKRRAVLVFSSGDEEPVSDEGKDGHSIFAWNLIKTLESVQGVTLGYEVYRTVSTGVKKDYPQEPQYGAVITAGHIEGGEYLFDAKPK